MREFTDSIGCKYDLDNPETYAHLPKTIKELRNRMFEKIGYSYLYMNVWHRECFFTSRKTPLFYAISTIEQRKRIKEFVFNFAKKEKEFRTTKTEEENVLWMQEQVFLFEDEIDNMC